MTIEELLSLMSSTPLTVLLVFLFPPLYALLLKLLTSPTKSTQSPWRYFYAVLVYLTCIPGLIMSILTAYQLFVQRANLLSLDIGVYLLPIISMLITLLLIRSQISFKDIPGFNRLSGLMLMLASAFGIIFILDRLRLLVIFHGSILWLLGLAALLFVLMKLGLKALNKRRHNS